MAIYLRLRRHWRTVLLQSKTPLEVVEAYEFLQMVQAQKALQRMVAIQGLGNWNE